MTDSAGSKTRRIRLDQTMVVRDLARDLDQARRFIMAGEVRVNGNRCDIPGFLVTADAVVEVQGSRQYASRGGIKLAHALDRAHLDVNGLVAVDVGASTGGFSDVLLQRGVARLFAIDVGYGDLAWKVRSDPRVTVLERTNIRHLEALPEGILADLAVIDASFISLLLVLPSTLRLLRSDAQIMALVKPQFEAARDQVGQRGVVRDASVHRQVLVETVMRAQTLGLHVAGIYVSPITGPAGNVEFLIWLQRAVDTQPLEPVLPAIDSAISEAHASD